jgi:hypothetical protein
MELVMSENFVECTDAMGKTLKSLRFYADTEDGIEVSPSSLMRLPSHIPW